MSNLQPPNYEPELSDVRTRTAANSSTSHSTPRRTAPRTSTRRPGSRSDTLNRIRRQASMSTSNTPVPPLALPPSTFPEERSNKRRRTSERKIPQAQVELIPMELRYCDGMRYDHQGAYGRTTQFCPEFVLQDDEKAYISKDMKINMILRQKNGQCFTLEKLVIRAPSGNYHSPVRAGMIFVTMEDTDLLSRTNYTIRYEAEDDSEEDADEDNPYGQTDDCEDGIGYYENDDENGVYHTPPSTRTRSIFSPAPYRGSTATGVPLTRPLGLLPPSSASTDTVTPHASLGEQLATPVPLLNPDWVFMETKRQRRTLEMTFSPAISGKYIFAKFFSKDDQNLEIEFIGAYGYSGRRFFPSSELR